MKKHNKKHKSYGFLGSLLMVSGIATAALGATDGIHIPATLVYSGQGSLVMNAPRKPMLLQQEVVMPSAPLEPTSQTGLIAFGALMMLLGFGLHAMIVLREQDEVAVPVRIKKAFMKEPRTSRKQMEVIWVERTIRL